MMILPFQDTIILSLNSIFSEVPNLAANTLTIQEILHNAGTLHGL